MVRILLGGRNLALEDVVTICAEDAAVQLDENTLAKLLPTSPQAKSALPCKRSVSDLVPPASLSELSPESARALILGVLLRALQPSGRVRPQVAEFLAALLNNGAQQHLRFPASANAFVVLADVLGGAQADHLQIQDAPGLFVHEFEWLQSGDLNGLSGLAALPAFALFVLLDVADSIAALTCEALPASIEAGAAPLHGNGATQVAANIRTMLKDSKQLVRGEIQRSIARIPVLHGCARDQTAPFERVFTAELNVSGVGSAETLAAAMSTLVTVAATLVAASRSRISDLVAVEEVSKDGDCEVVIAAAAAAENAAMNASRTCAAAAPMCISGEKPASETAFETFQTLMAATERVREQLAREAWLALRVIETREAGARTAFESSEATRKQRMEMAYAKVAQKENVSAKQLKNLEFHPRSFAFVLGTGSGALRRVLAADSEVQEKAVLAALQPLSTHFAELVRQMLIASNEMKKPKPPKGTRDYGKEEMMIRERVFATIRSVFQRHGATALDTPVFELRETLMGKYGEDSKLIYDLADQGGEQLSLRYDLTVPFARYLGTHNVRKLKRYHIARVYRRDNPAMNRGRFREFYQCDFDIAGEYDLMIPDAEVLAVLTEVLDALDLQFKVKFNHRRLLDAIMEICGVPDDKFRTICSAIDKLDKEPWSVVREEMLEKGLNAAAADKLGTFVSRNGEPFAMMAELRALPDIAQNAVATEALDELDVLFAYLDSLRVLPRISFDLSLARGLDYYTGVIYEAVLTDSDQVGSIAAGGRYDDLVGMFSARKVPAVGVSIGIERVFAIVEQRERARAGGIMKSRVQVLVVSAGTDLTKERMALCSELWAAGIVSEFVFKKAPKLQKQIDHALELGIPYIALMGEAELQKGVVVVKNVQAETQATVSRADILGHLQKCLAEQ